MNLTPPFLIRTDSYKTTHPLMYPELQEATAYMECRGGLDSDERIVLYGLRYLYETVISRQITMKDIEEADLWYSAHGVAKSNFYYPRDLWLAVIEEHNGYMPYEIKALREGTAMYPHIPFLQMTAKGKYARLVTWLEPSLTHIWSPIVTGTKSRRIRERLEIAFRTSVDDDMQFLLDSRFHDFGYRGASSLETAMTAGAAHLLSFEGTDNMAAGWLATQFNDGNPVGESVYASEHSVMTAWDGELEAVIHLINTVPEGTILSVVADSYDYKSFLTNILPIVAPLSQVRNLLFVVRPDSGVPATCVLDGLVACAKAFGTTINKKGYTVLNGAAVIQGDGLDLKTTLEIIDLVEFNNFSAQNVAYGMGGGLLQKQNRDTMRLATKLSRVVFPNGRAEDRRKAPKTDPGKNSLPGNFKVLKEDFGLTVLPGGPSSWADKRNETDQLETIWDCGPTSYKFESFADVRKRLNSQWNIRPMRYNVVSPELQAKIDSMS